MPRGIAFNIYGTTTTKETPKKPDKAHETLTTAKEINKAF